MRFQELPVQRAYLVHMERIEDARGYCWGDPAFGIARPGEVIVTSERDRSHPGFRAMEDRRDAN